MKKLHINSLKLQQLEVVIQKYSRSFMLLSVIQTNWYIRGGILAEFTTAARALLSSSHSTGNNLCRDGDTGFMCESERISNVSWIGCRLVCFLGAGIGFLPLVEGCGGDGCSGSGSGWAGTIPSLLHSAK